MAVRRRLALLLMAAALGTGSRPVWAGVNQWTSIGPEGGVIQSLVIDPQNPNIVYALAGGWIFKSTDGTASWHRLNPSAASGAAPHSISVLAIDPQDINSL